uniref:peptidylprolyl isomerase n=1 Tax=Thalassionema nitzschioides TaxID=33649 RepID=A0A7S1H5P0_9STRA|eukprot:CAMPEP_0194201088 /NCGR_PEP_ID=MMETSP0156-20130528/1453_1 /TAXON_ID=33649 /ORGANISM="Thalassionema nitzschioides, Strain L26-B" /LENGTH=210 /DNA_ID=CAMNT_0038926195 /DNA_START=57 /DNA_END=689 /DNA_ORIENTATION=-
MKFTISILALLSASFASASTELSVTVTDGPKECDDSEKVAAGQHVSMHYTGTIDESSETGEKGKKFDSSRDRDTTFDFEIGKGMVIQGWDKGLIGLCKGAKATLIIPPDMGYGDQGAGDDIPAGATLNFDVEVVGISDSAPPPPNYFAMIDEDKDGKITKEEMTAFFTKQGAPEIPEGLWESEDKDGDGVVTWEEFNGPKGETDPSKDEL